jgi:hypothetical protein
MVNVINLLFLSKITLMKKLYILLLSLITTASFSQATDLFFSQYGEGSGNNKFLEIYNGTGQDVDLSNYAFPSVGNAPNVPGTHEYWNEFPEGAVIANGDVYVIAHPSAVPEILATADHTHQYLSNGDDGYALALGSEESYTYIDFIGDFNGDPGDGWDVAGVVEATKDHTLTRKSSICQGNPDWDASRGTNEEDSEWIVTMQNDSSGLGSHVAECLSDVSVLITSPANGVTLAPGTSEVAVEFSVSNFDLGADGFATLAFQSMDAEGNMVDTEMLNNPTSPVTLTIACGLTYQVSIVLYNNDGSTAANSTVIFYAPTCVDCPDVGLVIITEILNNADGNDDGKEWFEIYNTSDSAIDLQDWTVTDEGSNAFTISESLVIEAGGFLVLGEETDPALNSGAEVDYAWGTNTNFTLGNGDDEVILSCGGVIIDMVAYDNGDTFPDPNSFSMALSSDAYNSIDNDLGENWGISLQLYGDGENSGTPGTEPQLSVNENQFTNVKLYPNPVVGDYINIEGINSDFETKIFNVLGKVVLQSFNSKTINISNLQSGIYLVELSSENSFITKKIIVE